MTQGDKPERPASKPLLQVLAGEVLPRPPFWLMRQAGRYLPEYRAVRQRAGSFLDLCLSPQQAAEVTLQPVRRFGMDAAILFSDILVVPHALGCALEYREGEGPVLEPIRSRAVVEALDAARVVARLAPVYETVERVAALLPQDTALIGFAGAPWTVATYMVEGGTSRTFEAVKRWALGAGDGFDLLIDRLVEATTAHLAAQIAAGAAAVQLFDSWCGVLPEDAFRRYVIAPTQRIVEALRAQHPHVPVIGFPRGAGLMYRSYVSETGISAIGLDSTVPCEIAHRTLQSLVPVQGNLDPVLLLVGGAPMEYAVEAIVQYLRDGPHIFNLGHGVLPETPVEHVARLAELLRRDG